ncbi:MAG TPA: hypothetical protein VHX12_12370 [Acidisoma sp.]|nr:hypothetical protein [Acidisoma sp.]
MSRYDIPTRDPGLSAVVGWDNPLQSYFAQVLRPETADDGDDNVILWVGAAPREVITVEDLARHLAPFVDLAPQVAEQLRADRAAKLGQAPTAVQQALLSIVRRAR